MQLNFSGQLIGKYQLLRLLGQGGWARRNQLEISDLENVQLIEASNLPEIPELAFSQQALRPYGIAISDTSDAKTDVTPQNQPQVMGCPDSTRLRVGGRGVVIRDVGIWAAHDPNSMLGTGTTSADIQWTNNRVVYYVSP